MQLSLASVTNMWFESELSKYGILSVSVSSFQMPLECLLRVLAFDVLLICSASIHLEFLLFISDVVNSGAFSPSVESDNASRVSHAVEGT